VGVFESGQFTRLGGAEPVSFRARLLASAQPGIEQRAGTEALRRDLLAHVNVLLMRVPPLREYAEDVPELLAASGRSPGRCGRAAIPALQRRGAETGCATIPGRTMCASSYTCASAADPRWRGRDPPGGNRARARGADAAQ